MGLIKLLLIVCECRRLRRLTPISASRRTKCSLFRHLLKLSTHFSILVQIYFCHLVGSDKIVFSLEKKFHCCPKYLTLWFQIYNDTKTIKLIL